MPYLYARKQVATRWTLEKGGLREGIAAGSDVFLSGPDHRINVRLQQANSVDVADRADRQHRIGGKSGISYAMRMDSSK